MCLCVSFRRVMIYVIFNFDIWFERFIICDIFVNSNVKCIGKRCNWFDYLFLGSLFIFVYCKNWLDSIMLCNEIYCKLFMI